MHPPSPQRAKIHTDVSDDHNKDQQTERKSLEAQGRFRDGQKFLDFHIHLSQCGFDPVYLGFCGPQTRASVTEVTKKVDAKSNPCEGYSTHTKNFTL